MESPSEPQCRTLSPWRGLLITASILSCWIQPTSAQVTIVPNPPFGEVNHNVTLEIRGFSGQALFYTWYRKAVAEPNRITRYTVETGEQEPAGIREKVLPNGSLLIPDLTLSDTDDYHVTIVNSRGDIILGQGNLAVYDGPDTPMIFPTALNYPVGATIELNCSAESNPPAQFTWLINGIQMASTSKLSIANVSLNHTGTYTCNASNSVTGLSRSKDINITVSERTIKPYLMANRTNMIENDALAFTCGTEQEGVDTLWFFNEKLLILNERMVLSMKNRTLTILTVKRENAGSYECEIRNPISSSRSDPFILHVNYGPENIKVGPNPKKGEVEVKIKGSLTLECHVESYPPAQYRWQVNGTKIPNFSNNTYVIKHATWEDSGKYTCMATNNVTNLSVSKSIRIKVIAEQYIGGSNGSSLSGGAITGIVIVVLIGVILIGVLIYIQCFRKARRISKYQLSEKNQSAHKHGEDIIMNENTVHLPGSALPAQGSGSSPTFPEELPKSSYQVCDQGEARTLSETKGEVKMVSKDEVPADGTENRNEARVETLDITRVDVCDKIDL
ncbi:putative pregnancy-specific beta-1-glycoprotein 7 isoform X1 [Sarcophilus harrisii]|uniref:Ig-like domain-containing protein n=1 Tax=Sarcophilus harrisii TaxID=9305 RepID=G3VJF1_SARHA|nr:putative pregnancy-specific beta-1-glycoprotein 7 isoform X1 [Sarcophilus harrisii]